MSGNKTKDSGKSVQTVLAPHKTNQGNKGNNQGNSAKTPKRTHSDVAEDSIEVDYTTISSDLKEIKKSLQDTVKKTDLDQLVQQKDLKELVTSICSNLLTALKNSMTEDFNNKLRERCGKLNDEVDALNIENHSLRERLNEKDRQIEILREEVVDCNNRSQDALKLANYNEQYSRKHNIRMVNYPEKRDEDLRSEFVEMVKEDLKVQIEPSDVIAIHRIPGKNGEIKPVIVKVKNTEMKISIMRKKKDLKNYVKFHDDITQRNLGLLTRISQRQAIDNAWFYNCSVYGKLKDSKQRIKFDLFDNIDDKIKKKMSDSD